MESNGSVLIETSSVLLMIFLIGYQGMGLFQSREAGVWSIDTGTTCLKLPDSVIVEGIWMWRAMDLFETQRGHDMMFIQAFYILSVIFIR